MSATWPKGLRRAACVAAFGAAAATLAACGSDNGAANAATSRTGDCVSGSLAGAGSTFQLNIEQQWAADFASSCPDAKVTYAGVGSGAGIQQFGAGTIAFAGSDVPMVADEQSAADKRCGSKALTFPVTAGGVAIIYHLDGVPELNLSAATLAAIFQGDVKRWDDPAVAKDNPELDLPSTPVVAYHRADGSGTTAVFSAFEQAAAGKVWKLGSDKELQWPAGQGATGSDGVTQGVKSTNGGITYAEVSFATAAGLPTAAVGTGDGQFTSISGSSVSQAIDTGFAPSSSGDDVVGTIDFAGLTGYPLSTVSYAIVCSQYSDDAVAELVKSYLGHALGDGQQAADTLGYAPLPDSIVSKAEAALENVS